MTSKSVVYETIFLKAAIVASGVQPLVSWLDVVVVKGSRRWRRRSSTRPGGGSSWRGSSSADEGGTGASAMAAAVGGCSALLFFGTGCDSVDLARRRCRCCCGEAVLRSGSALLLVRCGSVDLG